MNKIFPQKIYRFVKFTGFEAEYEYKTFSDGKILIGGTDPFGFSDEDSLIKIKENIVLKERVYIVSTKMRNTIFPFTDKNSELKIWDKFSNYGAGVAIGISTDKETFNKIKELFNLDLEKVIYTDDIPILQKQYTPEQIAREETSEIQEWIRKVIITKQSNFEYESEYRFFGKLKNYTGIGTARVISLPSEIITEVILGYAMEDSIKEKTISFCKKYLPKARLKYAIRGGEEIRIVPL